VKPAERTIWLLAALVLIAVGVFLFGDMGSHWRYILSRRAVKVAAMVISAVAIGVSTLAFQTVVQNRILTPGVVGLDSLYLFIQTAATFVGGRYLAALADPQANFFASLAVMVLFALGLYRLVFGRHLQDVYRLLLVGMVLGTFWGSLTTFMQVLIDPNEFLQLQGRMFASPSRVNADLLLPAALLVAGLVADLVRTHRYLDVLTLGRDVAMTLGVDYQSQVRRWLVDIAALTSVATALIGPMTFLGLIAANLGYQLVKHWRHGLLFHAVALVSVAIVVGGQWAVERVLEFSTPLSVVIQLVGGVYFLFLLTKERVVW